MLSSIKMLLEDLSRLSSKSGSLNSFLGYATDRIRFSILKGDNNNTVSALRRLTLRNGLTLQYRRNRGDIWSIREVLLEDCYELPHEQDVRVFVDLGANIGLTTLWASKRYAPEVLIAVEPQEENFKLAAENFKDNDLQVSFHKVAVGPEDGEAFFTEHAESNMGRVDAEGKKRVEVMKMDSLLRELPAGTEVDLLKVDIEGGEEGLFSGDLSWLARVRTIIAEFHPHLVNCEVIADRIKSQGFRHIKAGEVSPGQMECFVREA